MQHAQLVIFRDVEIGRISFGHRRGDAVVRLRCEEIFERHRHRFFDAVAGQRFDRRAEELEVEVAGKGPDDIGTVCRQQSVTGLRLHGDGLGLLQCFDFLAEPEVLVLRFEIASVQPRHRVHAGERTLHETAHRGERPGPVVESDDVRGPYRTLGHLDVAARGTHCGREPRDLALD